MQLADLKSKHRGGKSFRNLIDIAIGSLFYPPHKQCTINSFDLTSFIDSPTSILS